MKRKNFRTYGIVLAILYISLQVLDLPLNFWIYVAIVLIATIFLVIDLYDKFQSGELRKWWRNKK